MCAVSFRLFERVGIGCILLAAAVLKAQDFDSSGAIGQITLIPKFARVAIAEYEGALGVLVLAIGLQSQLLRAVVLATFAAFATVSSYGVAAGHSSCGCFGPLALPPLAALVLDVSVVGVVLIHFQRSILWAQHHRRLARWPMACFVAIFAAMFISATYGVLDRPVLLGDDGSIAVGAGSVVLTPSDWVGHAFPLLPWIEAGDALRTGKWIVVFHRRDCPRCQAMRDHCVARMVARSCAPVGWRLAFLDVSPTAPRAASVAAVEGLCDFDLQVSRKWIVETPTTIVLHDGLVAAAPNNALTLMDGVLGFRNRP